VTGSGLDTAWGQYSEEKTSPEGRVSRSYGTEIFKPEGLQVEGGGQGGLAPVGEISSLDHTGDWRQATAGVGWVGPFLSGRLTCHPGCSS
jgi:hypothetical protein